MYRTVSWQARALAVALIVACLVPMTVAAQDRRGLEVTVKELAGEYATVGKQIVVLIAIDKYREWMPLKNPVKDAKELKDILSRRYWVDQFIELYDTAATKAEILKLFEKLVNDTSAEDSIFIYYAGHGHLDETSETGYWIPVDAGTDRYEQRGWIANSQIRNLIGKMKARHVALISDSCFSGDILNPSRAATPDITSAYFRDAYSRVSRQVLTSGASETVPDDSPFTRQLKLALEGNTKPYLDPLMLFSEVRLGVSGTTPLFGTLRDSGHQDGGSFIFFLKPGTSTASGSSGAMPVVASAPSAATPTMTVTRNYGVLVVSAVSSGTLFLDGKPMGELPAGAEARLDSVEVGSRTLEIKYPDGKQESRTVTVKKDGSSAVVFTYTAPKPLASSTPATPAPPPTPVPVPAPVPAAPPTPSAPSARTPAATAALLAGFMRIPAGSFQMGSPESEKARFKNEGPQHQVTISREFWMAQYEVTFEEYDAFCAATARDKPDDYGYGRGRVPVIGVSWLDAVEYCNWRSRKEKLEPAYTISGTTVTWNQKADGYRLPTEAEWEYACRAGTTTATYFGDILTSAQSNIDGSIQYNTTEKGVYLKKPVPVGSYPPNQWKLYDMHGNVLEWCWDYFGDYVAKAFTDPIGPSLGTDRVRRGGSWYTGGQHARSAYRLGNKPTSKFMYLGFRLARTPKP